MAKTTTTPPGAFLALADERFVSLTTWRKNGEPVSTTVWIARDGDTLIVTTPSGSGKVKRVRHTPRVELRPCSRSGKVRDGVVPHPGVVEVVTDVGAVTRLRETFRRKYGLEFRIFMAIESIARRGHTDRLILRIRAS